MAGIVTCRAYLPHYFLTGEMLAREWGAPPSKLAKRVAGFDEDPLTMAAHASLEAGDRPEAVFFASTTAPYAEKSCASILAAVLDLPPEARTLDFGGSLRGAAKAIAAAADAVGAGSAQTCLVASGDMRQVEPGSPNEITYGDAGAAVIVGEDNLTARLLEHAGVSSELLHTWRRAGDRYVKSGDVRFSQQYGYVDNLNAVIAAVLGKAGLKPAGIAKVIIAVPEIRPIRSILKKNGFDEKAQWHDPLTGFTGFTGTPHPLVLLASALENSQPGEKILLCSYGDGADAMLLETTERVKELAESKPLKAQLKRRKEIPSYTRFLDIRNALDRWDHIEGAFASTIMEHRDKAVILGLKGRKCTECSTVSTLKLPVCPACHARDAFEEVKLSRTGSIFTFSQEYYFPTPEPPVSMVSVDLDGGGRLLTQMTECEPEDVKIGGKVELVFRKMHEAGGYHNYYWKARPLQQRS
jgi:3-hydroxy-3-methylglutaryl CoA synthase